MHVPYSMRDDEPDLYGSLGGRSGDDSEWETQTKWESESRDPDSVHHAVEVFRRDTYVYTQEQMNKVIQLSIGQQKKLELQLLDARELLTDIYNRAESLPSGYSQKIREYLTR